MRVGIVEAFGQRSGTIRITSAMSKLTDVFTAAATSPQTEVTLKTQPGTVVSATLQRIGVPGGAPLDLDVGPWKTNNLPVDGSTLSAAYRTVPSKK